MDIEQEQVSDELVDQKVEDQPEKEGKGEEEVPEVP